jgi:prepilin peptidase CpaA
MSLEPITWWAAVGVLAFVAIAVYTDLKWRRIPNEITVSSLVIALILQTAFGGTTGLLTALGGFAVGFGILLLLWLTGGGGGGDVKLMGAAGAWVGPMPILMIFIGSALFAIACTMVMMVRQQLGSEPNAVAESSSGSVGGTSQRNVLKQSVPYAVPMGMATLCVIAFLLAIDGAGH